MLTFNIDDLLPYIKSSEQSLGIGQLTYLLAGQNSRELNSALYANRGATHYLATQLDKAFEDFEKSLEYNHLNYVSYFNLHSFYYRTKKMQSSLKNLCCSISCLYLLRGKEKKDEGDINKAIKYCENNLEAHLAKGLHYLQNGKHKLALNELNWVLEIDPSNRKVKLIKSKIEQKINPEQQNSNKDVQNKGKDEKNVQKKKKRLQCSLYEDENLDDDKIEEELANKIEQFNMLYSELNQKNHLEVLASPPVYLLSREVKRKESENRQNIPSQQINHPQSQQDHDKKPIQFKSNTHEVSEFQASQKIEAKPGNQQNGGESSVADEKSKQIEDIERDSAHKKLPFVTEQKLISEADQSEVKVIEQPKEKEEEQYILNEKKQKIKQSQIAQEATKQVIEGYLYTSPQKKPNDMSEPRENSSSYTFRTPEEEKNLSIRIHRVEITNISQEQLGKLKNIYCRFKYGRKKFETKDISEDFNNQQFDQSFETELEDQPQVLQIQVFNKELLAFNDTQLGRGEKQVTMTGRIEVPIYLDEEKQDLAGKVYLDIRYK